MTDSSYNTHLTGFHVKVAVSNNLFNLVVELVSWRLPHLNSLCHERACSPSFSGYLCHWCAECTLRIDWCDVSLLCKSGLMILFPIPALIWSFLRHPSPLSIPQAVKPCECGCHGPSLIFSATIKLRPHSCPAAHQWDLSSSNWEEYGRVTPPCSQDCSQLVSLGTSLCRRRKIRLQVSTQVLPL